MTFKEIQDAILQNKNIYWVNEGYKVIKDNLNQYLIICLKNNNCVGLNLSIYFKSNKNNDFFIL